MRLTIHGSLPKGAELKLKSMMALVYTGGLLAWLQYIYLMLYSVASLIRTLLIRTPVWEPIPIPQQIMTHLSGNSVIRTVSLGTEVSG